MKKKIKVQTVSFWSIGITIVLAVLFIVISIQGQKEFRVMKEATNQYIECENSARQLQEASDYLTEQARRYAATGERKYMNSYFKEANVVKRRDHAVENLGKYFKGSEVFTSLQSALECSEDLMETEYYSMKLVASATGASRRVIPDEVESVTLSEEDRQLSSEEKMSKAQKLLNDNAYQDQKQEIMNDVSGCMNQLIRQTKDSQGRAATIF